MVLRYMRLLEELQGRALLPGLLVAQVSSLCQRDLGPDLRRARQVPDTGGMDESDGRPLQEVRALHPQALRPGEGGARSVAACAT